LRRGRGLGHVSAEATTMEIDEFQGQHVTADHGEYDTARAIWNGAIDGYPRLIARCSGTADVTGAVRSPATTTWRSPCWRPSSPAQCSNRCASSVL
jgi:hypothetical protein